jgi:hypothetical protein
LREKGVEREIEGAGERRIGGRGKEILQIEPNTPNYRDSASPYTQSFKGRRIITL